MDGSVLSKRAFEKDINWQSNGRHDVGQDKAKHIEEKLLDNTFTSAGNLTRAGIDIGTAGFGDLSEAGCLVALVGMLIYFLTLALYAAGLLVIMDAPMILAEIVFEALLAAGLVRLAKQQAANGWLMSAFSFTWPSFAFVIIYAVLFVLWANIYAPGANSIPEIFNIILIKHGKS